MTWPFYGLAIPGTGPNLPYQPLPNQAFPTANAPNQALAVDASVNNASLAERQQLLEVKADADNRRIAFLKQRMAGGSSSSGARSANGDPLNPQADLEKRYTNVLEGVTEIVAGRISIAQMANTLDLPDNAIAILAKAYEDVEYVFDMISNDLNGQEPSSKLNSILAGLKDLKTQVLTQMKSVIRSNGGPDLTLGELDAMLGKDKGDGTKSPASKSSTAPSADGKPAQVGPSINDNFSLSAGGEKGKAADGESGMQKLAGGTAKLVQEVKTMLQQVAANPDAGIGFARMMINQALTRLEQCRAMLRIGSIGAGGASLFKPAGGGGMDQDQAQINALEQQAMSLFRAVQDRNETVSRSVLPDAANRPESQKGLSAPAKAEAQGLKRLDQDIAELGGFGFGRSPNAPGLNNARPQSSLFRPH